MTPRFIYTLGRILSTTFHHYLLRPQTNIHTYIHDWKFHNLFFFTKKHLWTFYFSFLKNVWKCMMSFIFCPLLFLSQVHVLLFYAGVIVRYGSYLCIHHQRKTFRNPFQFYLFQKNRTYLWENNHLSFRPERMNCQSGITYAPGSWKIFKKRRFYKIRFKIRLVYEKNEYICMHAYRQVQNVREYDSYL